MKLLSLVLFSVLAGAFASNEEWPVNHITPDLAKARMTKSVYGTVVNDSYGRPLHYGSEFFYSIQNQGSRLYQSMDRNGQKFLTPVLDRYNQGHFADIWLINTTENFQLYTFWYTCFNGNQCSGSGFYATQLGTRLSSSKSAHPYYDSYWLQATNYLGTPIGQYLADLGNNQWGYCTDCTGAESSTKWIMKLHPDIKLYGRLYDFVFQMPSQEIISSAVSKVGYESQVIVNNANESISRSIERKFYSNGYKQLSFTGSLQDSFSLFDILSANIEQSLSFKNSTVNLNLKHAYSKISRDIRTPSFNVPEPYYYEETMKEQITAPPRSILRVDTYVNWVDDLVVPFTAKLRVTGDDVYNTWKTVGSLGTTEMSSWKIQRLLDIYKINETLIASTSNSRTYQIRGVFKGSFALNSQIESIGLP